MEAVDREEIVAEGGDRGTVQEERVVAYGGITSVEGDNRNKERRAHRECTRGKLRRIRVGTLARDANNCTTATS